ncbi:MAG: prolipoprotein diacylglyceryl transferase, partial [Spirochaetes bacterium]|nr:prolipoprotein diacylglyceryl transferase [Spirochaetota bacterium]
TKSIEISTFGLLLGLAFYLSFLFFESELKNNGKDPEIAYKLLIAIIPSAIIGAKIISIFSRFSEFISNPLNILFSGADLSFYGGLILSIIVSVIVLKVIKEDFFEIADILAPAVMLGYSIGKFGSHLSGFSYGIKTSSFLGVAYPNGYTPVSASVYPTALFEMFISMVFFILLIKLSKKSLPKGTLFLGTLALNSITFFMMNFITADIKVFLSLSVNQILSITTFIISAVIISISTLKSVSR